MQATQIKVKTDHAGHALIDLPLGIPDYETELLIVWDKKRNEDDDFWMKASQSSLDKVWDNAEDDVYAELLKK
jgi:hypothetical protein